MSIAAAASSPVAAVSPPRGNDEANESAAERTREAVLTQPAAQPAPAVGTGRLVDVTA